jgi:hypothetical protein
MRVLSIYVFLLILTYSCKKSGSEKPDPGVFYARFKINDSAVNYTNDSNYYFEQGKAFSNDSSGNSTYKPTTWITPVAHRYSNIGPYYLFGQIFSYTSLCGKCLPDWIQYGNTLFVTGPWSFCYLGTNFAGGQFPLVCYDDHRMSIYLMSKEGNLLSSSAGSQPAWSYYTLDMVTEFHMRADTISSGSYDKIISGHFACRAFNTMDSTDYLDITEGEFRMPIWYEEGY